MADPRLAAIQDMLGRLPAAKRTAMLKLVTDLFVDNAARCRPDHVALFDALFSQLTDKVENEAMAALSRRLASFANAPQIVHRLARDDDIAIAEPVLVHSPCLDDSVLADIARTKSQMHLLAIACRPQLGEAVTELLVQRGDDVVVRYVANNRGARLSAASVVALLERAKGDDALAELLTRRDDVAAPTNLTAAPAQETSDSPAQNASANPPRQAADAAAA